MRGQMFQPDSRPGTPVERANDNSEVHPRTPEEIAAHNAARFAEIEAAAQRQWSHLTELVKGRDPAEKPQRASARRR